MYNVKIKNFYILHKNLIKYFIRVINNKQFYFEAFPK